MNITDQLILASDVMVIPAASLDPKKQVECGCGPDDFVVTRPRSRTASRVVNQAVAELLDCFDKPCTIVEAVVTVSTRHGQSAEKTLPEAYQVLVQFLQARWLVSAHSDEPLLIEPSFRPGDLIDGNRVLECRHLVEDTELYQVRDCEETVAALKIVRASPPAGLLEQFAQEALVLRQLEGVPVPRLIREGSVASRPYLLMTWAPGIAVTRAAQDLRQIHGARSEAILGLCASVLEGYRQIHDRRIVHGDVYPHNVLADARSNICVVDFGIARLFDSSAPIQIGRKGVADFYEPELAQAIVDRRSLPGPSPAGEQYALAALLYVIVTGSTYIRFSVHPDEMMHQIVEQRPQPFASRGHVPWPELEAVLGVALAKDPAARFSSVEAFAGALATVRPRQRRPPRRSKRGIRPHLPDLLRELDVADLAAVSVPADLPTSSVTHGAAGIALGLLSVATRRDDARLLALADAWASRACATADDANAFFSTTLRLDRSRIGDASIYFGRPGVALAQAAVAQAMGNDRTFSDAVAVFADGCQKPVSDDLTLGRAGIVLACALLLDGSGPDTMPRSANAVRRIRSLSEVTLREMMPTVLAEPRAGDHLGMAHGRAGMIYAALLHSDVTGDEPPPQLRNAIDALVARGREHGRGLRWPITVTDGSAATFMESWCHGSPGYVLLFTAAARVFRDTEYLVTAERAAWTAWEDPGAGGTLCCGLAGRAHSLLSLYRHTGDATWIDKARRLTTQAIDACESHPGTRWSLFQGALGAAVLAADFDHLEGACFPLIERGVTL